MEDVTHQSSSPMTSLWQAAPHARVCGGQRGETDVEQLERCEERWDWGFEGVEEEPGVGGQPTVRSQLELPLRAMSESVGYTVAGVGVNVCDSYYTREHGDVPGPDSCWGPGGCPGAVPNWSYLSWMQWSGELAPSLVPVLRRADPAPRLGSMVELALMVWVWVN